MNILFVGGSNLVIRDGLSTLIPQCLSASGVEVQNVFNIAVGATGSLFGLENLSMFGKKNIDLVFVEYGINDLPLHSNDKRLWEYAFSALLDKISEKYPNAMLVTILLGRRRERFWEKQAKMHERMSAITQRYGGLVVDIDSLLKHKSQRIAALDDFYLDDSHYQSPYVTRYISETVVSEFLVAKELGFFNDKKVLLDNELPRLGLSSVSGEIKCYENSRFMQKTTVLEKNQPVVLSVPGVPVGISFISEFDSCSLLIEAGGKKKIINTKRKKASLGRFSFILKQTPLYSFFESELGFSDMTEVKLTAVDTNSAGWDASVMQNTYGMEPAEPEINSKIFISHISSCFVKKAS